MKTKIISVLAVASMALPSPVLAEAQLKVEDTVAGFGTDIQVRGVSDPTNAGVAVLPPFGEEIIFPLSDEAITEEKLVLAGSDTQVAGTYDVELFTDDDVLAQTSFEVIADALDLRQSTLQASHEFLSADGRDEVHIGVILRDQFGNTLSGRPIELISSRSSDTIAPIAQETDASGMQEFAVSTYEPGTISLRAMDLMSGKLLSQTLTIQAQGGMGGYGQYGYQNSYAPTPAFYPGAGSSVRNPAPTLYRGNRIVGNVLGRSLYGQINGFDVVESFLIDVPMELNVNEDATIRITAIDPNGRRVEDYTGTVLLASTDSTAMLPLEGRVQFLPQNLGEKVLTLGLRFRTAGEHILHVEDSTDPNINAQAVINVIGGVGPTSPNISITSHEQDGFINSLDIVVEGDGPPFINVVISGGTQDTPGETDQDGHFSIPVTLKEGQTDHTLRARDETGRFDSGDLHLILDDVAPEVDSITFDPDKPIEEDSVNLVVESEGGLASATMTLEEEVHELVESRSASGTYELSFTAPEAGAYQPVIAATDQAGNTTEVRNNFVVEKKSLPQVQNVQAQPKVGSISLVWDPVTEERVDAYRIYVGEDPSNFLYTLDTDRATAAATVAGLQPGVTYYFAVTALQGDRESAEKSEVVQAGSLGMGLTITEQDSALMVEWTSLPVDTPLSSYLLEYGVSKEEPIEQRTINGELRAFTLRDLINGITYYLRLTPVATTGDVLSDLASEGVGTPQGSGFTPTGGDPVPPSVLPADITPPPPPGSQYHGSAPGTPATGLPLPVWIALSIAGVGLLLHWHRRRTLRMTMDFMKQMEYQYRNG